MTSPITLNHQVLKDSLEMVSNLDPCVNWLQADGFYDPDKNNPCCIGTHIAKHFNVQSTKYEDAEPELENGWSYYYKDGIDYLCEELGISQMTLESLLYICGAPFDPFSTVGWNEEPKKIWENMMSIEKVLNEESLNDLAYIWRRDNDNNDQENPLSIIEHPEAFDNILEFNS